MTEAPAGQRALTPRSTAPCWYDDRGAVIPRMAREWEIAQSGYIPAMKQHSARRTGWLLCVTLAAIALGGAGPLGLRWTKAYRVAKYHGQRADLRGAFLPFA